MKKKLLSITMVAILSVLSLTGCGGDSELSKMSKSELIAECQRLQSDYGELASELEQTKTTAAALTEDGKVNAAISTTGDGTGRFTFNSVDSKIVFPTSFVYPNSNPIVPDGKVNIVNSVSVNPSSTWISRINGSSLELEQSTNKISGTIKVNETTDQLTVEQLQSEVLQPWFQSLANSDVTYNDIFINSTSFGKQAQTPIMIDSENAYLICGMAAFGMYSVTYVFVYRGDRDETKDELIMNLLNTVTIDGSTFVIQK